MFSQIVSEFVGPFGHAIYIRDIHPVRNTVHWVFDCMVIAVGFLRGLGFD